MDVGAMVAMKAPAVKTASTQHWQRRMKNPRTQKPVSGGLCVADVVNMYAISASVEGLNTV